MTMAIRSASTIMLVGISETNTIGYYQGGNRKNRRLRFSKSGHAGLEEAYATHYMWNQSQEQKQHVIARSMPDHSQEA